MGGTGYARRLGQDVDALVQVAVAGGLRYPGVESQVVDLAAVAEPAHDQHGLTERPQRAAARRRADRPEVGDQQSGEKLHDRAGTSTWQNRQLREPLTSGTRPSQTCSHQRLTPFRRSRLFGS